MKNNPAPGNAPGFPTKDLLDVLDDLSICRDMMELILMAHKHTPAGDTEAKAVSTTAWQVIRRMDDAMAQLHIIKAERTAA